MCNWEDKVVTKGKTRKRKIPIPAGVFSDACRIIRQRAQEKQGPIRYKDLENELKNLGHRKIYRGTIGDIVGEVSIQVSQVTNPSIYPSAIVVRKDTNQVGIGFWGLHTGTNRPLEVSQNQRRNKLREYQNDVFNRPWNCNC